MEAGGTRMDANDLERLTERIATLESFNRRLRRAIAVLLVVVASAALMAQLPVPKATPQRKKAAAAPAPKVVEAEQFVLKSGGRVLATLGVTYGGPMLRLVGPTGTDRALFALDGAGTPRLVLLRADGSRPVTVALTPDGVPRVEVSAPDKSAARLTTGPGGPEIAIADGSGLLRLALDLKADGPAMTMGGKTAFAALSATDAGPSFALSDPDGRQRITMIVVSQQAVFGIRDAKGDVRVGLEVKAENPALGLYGPNGKPLFVKP